MDAQKDTPEIIFDFFIDSKVDCLCFVYVTSMCII